jgi:hypothetical protein
MILLTPQVDDATARAVTGLSEAGCERHVWNANPHALHVTPRLVVALDEASAAGWSKGTDAPARPWRLTTPTRVKSKLGDYAHAFGLVPVLCVPVAKLSGDMLAADALACHGLLMPLLRDLAMSGRMDLRPRDLVHREGPGSLATGKLERRLTPLGRDAPAALRRWLWLCRGGETTRSDEYAFAAWADVDRQVAVMERASRARIASVSPFAPKIWDINEARVAAHGLDAKIPPVLLNTERQAELTRNDAIWLEMIARGK